MNPTPVFYGLQRIAFASLCIGCGCALVSSTSFCLVCLRSLFRTSGGKKYLWSHEGAARGLLHALRGVAPTRAAYLILRVLRRRNYFACWREQGFDLILAAPQRECREQSGLGYLVELMARELEILGTASAFQKEKGRQQHGLNLRGRMDTHCFIQLKVHADRIYGRRCLVLDDVYTSGTTLDLCAYLLRQAGAARVETFTLTRQVMPGLRGEHEESH